MASSSKASIPVKATTNEKTGRRPTTLKDSTEEEISKVISDIDIKVTRVGLEYDEPPYEIPQTTGAVRSLVQRIQDILHNKYNYGEMLDDGDEELLEWLLQFHHNLQLKLGSEGISHIKVDHYVKAPGMHATKCFHVVRKDGSSIDFSYKKCLANMAAEVPEDLPRVAEKLREAGPRAKPVRRSFFS